MQRKVKKNSSVKLVFVMFSLAFFFTLFTFLNVLFINGGSHSLNQIWHVLTNWGTSVGSQEWEIKRGLWSVAATFLGALGLSLGAIAAQSLTKNPLAEASTLGLTQSAIFGIIFIASFGLIGLWAKYLFALIAGLIASLLLLFIIYKNKKSTTNQKMILAGLAIGIIFKTLSFIFKQGDANWNSLSFIYVLGGAELISSNPLAVSENAFIFTLVISSSLIGAAFILILFNLQGMNLLEAGDQRAKTLGHNTSRTKVVNVLILALTIPAAVIVVGNIAFIGLIAIHWGRWISKSRNYGKVMPLTVLIALVISQMGLQLTAHFPQINSGLWMTFIGAPYLIYAGVRGLG